MSEAFDKYAELFRQLGDLIATGDGDSMQADVLRDQMDPVWYAMTEQERYGLAFNGPTYQHRQPTVQEMTDINNRFSKWSGTMTKEPRRYCRVLYNDRMTGEKTQVAEFEECAQSNETFKQLLARDNPDWEILDMVRGLVRPEPKPAPVPEGIEALVAQDIAARQALGIAKYGTTVGDSLLPLEAWLQHAYEESLDLPVYLKRALIKLQKQKNGQ